MRILLVDDDPSVRAVIRRILRRRLNVEIVEASNGLEALELLSRQRYRLVILDHMMPVLNGIDTLRAIREAPALAGTVVIMSTAVGDAETVKRVAGYGVAEYILKPLRPGDLLERVTRIIQALELSDAETPRGARLQPFRPLELTPEASVLVADGSPEFRQFFRREIAAFCQVREAETGLDAFRACLAEPPAALFIGSDLGVFSGDQLAHHVRRETRTDAVRIVGVMPPNLLRRVKKQSPYEAIILRTFVSDLFRDGFQGLLRRPGRLSALLGMVPDLKLVAIAAFEEAVGASLRAAAIPRAPDARDASKFARAVLRLTFRRDRIPLLVALAVPRKSTRRQAGLASPQPDGPAQTGEALLVELLDRMGHSLAQEFAHQGLEVVVEQAVPGPASPAARVQQADDQITVDFDIAGKGLRVRLDLRLDETAASAVA